MKKRLTECFEEQHTFYLVEANYKKIDTEVPAEGVNLICEDSITSEVVGNIFKVSFKRTVRFNPEALYLISVELGSDLKIKKGKQKEVSANKDELLNGLLETGAVVISNMVSRASLVVSSLTASYGQQPIVTPPTVLQKKD